MGWIASACHYLVHQICTWSGAGGHQRTPTALGGRASQLQLCAIEAVALCATRGCTPEIRVPPCYVFQVMPLSSATIPSSTGHVGPRRSIPPLPAGRAGRAGHCASGQLVPLATATLPTGQLATYRNGGLPAEPAAAARRMCVQVARRSKYTPQLQARRTRVAGGIRGCRGWNDRLGVSPRHR